jgi:hypothetical protein
VLIKTIRKAECKGYENEEVWAWKPQLQEKQHIVPKGKSKLPRIVTNTIKFENDLERLYFQKFLQEVAPTVGESCAGGYWSKAL